MKIETGMCGNIPYITFKGKKKIFTIGIRWNKWYWGYHEYAMWYRLGPLRFVFGPMEPSKSGSPSASP